MQRWLWIVFLIPFLAQAKCTRVFRVPYDKVHENAQPGNDVLEAVITSMGCRFRKVYLDATNARHHRALAEGKLDILAEASKLPERESYAWFSQPYRTETVVLIAKRDDTKINALITLSDIEKNKYRVIADEHSWWGTEVAQYTQKWKAAGLLVPVSQGGAEYKELQLNRADVLVSTDASFKVAHQQFPNTYINNPHIYDEPVHFMFSRTAVSRAEVDDFDRALTLYLQAHKTN